VVQPLTIIAIAPITRNTLSIGDKRCKAKTDMKIDSL
jgi:hypothetical protein